VAGFSFLPVSSFLLTVPVVNFGKFSHHQTETDPMAQRTKFYMAVMRAKPIIALAAVLLMGLVACEEDPDCPDSYCLDCGKIDEKGIEEYLLKKVTQDDFAKFSGISGIEIDACMRYKMAIKWGSRLVTGSTGIDEESITIVDDCCCELCD